MNAHFEVLIIPEKKKELHHFVIFIQQVVFEVMRAAIVFRVNNLLIHSFIFLLLPLGAQGIRETLRFTSVS
jgi:hypothetical protein